MPERRRSIRRCHRGIRPPRAAAPAAFRAIPCCGLLLCLVAGVGAERSSSSLGVPAWVSAKARSALSETQAQEPRRTGRLNPSRLTATLDGHRSSGIAKVTRSHRLLADRANSSPCVGRLDLATCLRLLTRLLVLSPWLILVRQCEAATNTSPVDAFCLRKTAGPPPGFIAQNIEWVDGRIPRSTPAPGSGEHKVAPCTWPFHPVEPAPITTPM